jgi:hypothetical protein
MKLSLMSTVYQLAENVKQYAEIKSTSSGGGVNGMQRSKLRRKRKLRRRSEQYAEIKAQKEKHKLRVRSLSSHLIKKLTVLIVSYYGRRSYE